MEPKRSIRIGSRNSKLALIQTNFVRDLLCTEHPELDFPIHSVMVRGDADKITPFALITNAAGTTKTPRSPEAAKSLWTEEMEDELRALKLDLLVHSLKDLPTNLPDGCFLGAILGREDPSDALIVKPGLPYTTLGQLPRGSVVGTSSTRRKALLRRHYPHLLARECRGNVDTRLSKLDNPDGEFTCIILATAGLTRMGLEHRITARLSPLEFPYAVGQGAIGIETRPGDDSINVMVARIQDNGALWSCVAERALLRTLQGGCSSPVGVFSFIYDKEVMGAGQVLERKTMLRLYGSVVHPHGWTDVRANACRAVDSDGDAEALGVLVARKLLAAGADKILDEIREIEVVGFKAHFELPVDSSTNGPVDGILVR